MARMNGDPYAEIAEWYDLEHDALTADVECYASLIESVAGNRASVLEIGSGTGRIAAALALAGHQVTGIEPSDAMRGRASSRLTKLPERVARRVTCKAGDATSPGLMDGERFDVVLFGLNVFAHLTTSAARQAALVSAAEHIAPDGLLLLDLDVLGLRRLAETMRQLWWQGTWPASGDREVSHFVTADGSREPGVVQTVHFYDVASCEGGLSRIVSRMPLAVLTHGEMELLLHLAGFSVEAVYGSYDLAPYDDAAPRMIFDARLQSAS